MNIKYEIERMKKLVVENKYNFEQLVKYLEEHKIYHTVAVIIFSKIFNKSIEDSEKIIYANKTYSKYKNEVNPFNLDFIDGAE